MKLRHFMLPLLTIATLNANASFETVKVTDGQRAYCQKKSDVTKYANRNGVYSAKARKITVTKDGMLEVDMAMFFQRCTSSEGNFKFSAYSPLKDVMTKVISLDGKPQNIRIDVNSAVAKVYKDGDYSLLQEIDLSDNALQTHKISIPLESTISNIAKKELELGSKVIGNFDLIVNKSVTHHNIEKSYSVGSTARLGAFRVHFTLESTEQGMRAQLK